MGENKAAALVGAVTWLLLGATVALVLLRLCGVVRWAWWVLLAPLWVPFALLALLIVTAYLTLRIQAGRERRKAGNVTGR